MQDIYIEYNFLVEPINPGVEILIAELGYAGFESFVENDKGVLAYIQKQEHSDSILGEVEIIKSDEFSISYSLKEIEQINWNEEWEKHFDPILVDNSCFVRAPFHESKTVDYEIVIEPKMSFGTGHHETTSMMLSHILKANLKGESVLDMGCGTAVLAILAYMRGAKSVDAIDIDQWCYDNSVENINRNNCSDIQVFKGDANVLKSNNYSVIFANINRNILLQDIKTYSNSLLSEGELFLSGFYKEDLAMIEAECNKFSLKLDFFLEKNNWIAAKFKR
jgi:ribosomal protein L11 methyltransferase